MLTITLVKVGNTFIGRTHEDKWNLLALGYATVPAERNRASFNVVKLEAFRCGINLIAARRVQSLCNRGLVAMVGHRNAYKFLVGWCYWAAHDTNDQTLIIRCVGAMAA